MPLAISSVISSALSPRADPAAAPAQAAPPRGAPGRGKFIPVVWGTAKGKGVVLAQGTAFGGNGYWSLAASTVVKINAVASVIGICQGPVAGTIQRFFRRREAGLLAAISKIIETSKTYSIVYSAPTVWTDGIKYEGIVQLRSDGLTLDEDGKLPDIEWEIQGRQWVSGNADALPWDVALDLVTDPLVGLGWSSSRLLYATGLDGLAASSWQRWCQVHGFRISRWLGEQVPAWQLLDELATSTASVLHGSIADGKVRFIPLGDSEVSGNGYTWTPPAAIDLDIADIWKEEEDPVRLRRRPESETYNLWAVSFPDRARDYEVSTIDYLDAAHAAATGKVREGPVISAPWVTSAAHAHKLAQLAARRSIYQRNTASFRLPPQYAYIEPGDIVALTDGRLLAGATYRVLSVDHGDRGDLELEALEWGSGASTFIALSTQAAAPTAVPDFSPQTVTTRTYRQDAEPSGVPLFAGDLWYDTNDGNKLHRYDGATWVVVPLGSGALDPPPVYTTAGRPAAGASWLGKPIVVKDTSAPGLLQTCLQNSDGSYSWVSVAYGSY